MALISFASKLKKTKRPTMYFLYLIFIKKLEIENPSNLYTSAGIELLVETFLFSVALAYVIYL